MACFACLFPLHVPLAVFEGHHGNSGFSVHLVGMWIAFAAGTLLITIFVGKVSEALRKREQEVLSLQSQLARQERLASIVTLAAGAAHELGSPLATIAIAAKDLENAAYEGAVGAEIGADARLIRAEVERCRRILSQMSVQSGDPQGGAPPVDLHSFLAKVRADFLPPAQRLIQIGDHSNGLHAVLPDEATRQVLSALIKNALDSDPGGNAVRISADVLGGMVRFVVADQGCGMSSETLNRIGEPFFTTKAPGQGIGLGTFLARIFTERMGGNLVFESVQGKGTTAILEIPQGFS
jgi:two-component system sensor histidine kinase RegB